MTRGCADFSSREELVTNPSSQPPDPSFRGVPHVLDGQSGRCAGREFLRRLKIPWSGRHPNRGELVLVVTALFASNDACLRRFQRTEGLVTNSLSPLALPAARPVFSGVHPMPWMDNRAAGLEAPKSRRASPPS